MTSIIYPIAPVPKPRMTQRDLWRQPVKRYWDFCKEVRARGVTLNAEVEVIFHIAIFSSWSKKKREQMLGQPHQQKPDLDNFVKALLDAVHKEDSHIWHIKAKKMWALEGAIEICT